MSSSSGNKLASIVMLLGLSENMAGCVSDPPKVVVYFITVQHGCDSILESMRNKIYESIDKNNQWDWEK